MKIGAYELSSQLNIYSRFSSSSIERVDTPAKAEEVKKPQSNELEVAYSVDGGKYFESPLYSKYSAEGVVLNPKVQKLDDFSLVSAKDDVKIARIPDNTEEPNYKEIISDAEMDDFLKKAFKLFE